MPKTSGPKPKEDLPPPRDFIDVELDRQSNDVLKLYNVLYQRTLTTLKLYIAPGTLSTACVCSETGEIIPYVEATDDTPTNAVRALKAVLCDQINERVSTLLKVLGEHGLAAVRNELSNQIVSLYCEHYHTSPEEISVITNGFVLAYVWRESGPLVSQLQEKGRTETDALVALRAKLMTLPK